VLFICGKLRGTALCSTTTKILSFIFLDQKISKSSQQRAEQREKIKEGKEPKV
jgi:hypothetical protein